MEINAAMGQKNEVIHQNNSVVILQVKHAIRGTFQGRPQVKGLTIARFVTMITAVTLNSYSDDAF